MSLDLGVVVAARPRVASLPAPPHPAPPLLGHTDSPKVDAVIDVVNATASPFQNAPDPARGSLGVVEHDIGAVMGVVGAPFQLLDTGFAMVTAPIAAMMPAFPAAYLTVLHLGSPHAHMHPLSLTPPNPVPVPLPSLGNVMLAGCVSVLISGMPAARAGDVGLAPLCFGFGPVFDVWFGSSNTWIGGSRAARLGDVTRHCNPMSAMNAMGKAMGAIGVVAGAVSAGASASAGQAMQAAMQAAQAAADAAALAMSALLGKDPGIPPSLGVLMLGNPTVLIGGFPMPDTLELLSGMLKGLKMLGRAVSKSKAFAKLLSKVGLCHAPGEPVHPYTGEVFNDFEDYRASDTDFRWERHYRSGWNEADGPLGFGFRHFYQRTLTFLRKRALYATHDGELVELEKADDGSYVASAGFKLSMLRSGRYELRTDRDETLEFEAQPSTPPSGRLVRYQSEKVDVRLSYEAGGRLDALTEYSADGLIETRLVYDAHGHIEGLSRSQRGQPPVTISRYVYGDDCLVEWYDALGAVARFRYDVARRMVQGTDRRGYSFHWQYDPKNGRCIEARGDDGLWGVKAKYEGSTSTFTEPDGGKWTYKHYPDGTISHLVGPDGGVLQFVKDESGRVAKQILPGGVEYPWVYDASGKHIGRIDPWGNLLPPEDVEPDPPNPLAHDGPTTPMSWLWGRPLGRMVAHFGGLPYAIYQELTRIAALPRAAGAPLEIGDALGRVVERRHADGSVERFRRDAEGNTVAREDAAGSWTHRSIGSWNLVVSEQSPLGHTTRYAYTHRGARSAVIDPNGNRTDYVVDKRHRLTEVLHDGELHVRYAYNAHDTIVAEYDREGQRLVGYETNELGLHCAVELSSGEKYTYEYDELGNFTSVSSTQHSVRQRHRRRQIVSDLRDGQGVVHDHDDDLELSESIYFDAFIVDYDSSHPDRRRVLTPDGGEHAFWRMEPGILVRQNGNGTHEACAFDADERLTGCVSWRGEAPELGPMSATGYRYNLAGELVAVTDSERGVVRYGYDADHRLVSQESRHGVRQYNYDGAGNLARTPSYSTIERGAGNLLAFTNVDRFQYDSRRRLSQRTRWDGVTTTYIYDSIDQLIEVRWSDRAERWRAAYDGLGRRLWRDHGGIRTDFFWDGDRLAAERAPDGKIRLYVYVNQDALVPFMWLDYESEDAKPESGKAYYLFCSPTGLPLRVEDSRRAVVWRAKEVDAYGSIEVEGGASVEHRLRFAGHYYDEHLELFYNRFRDYDPKLGRYLQPDPLGHAGSANLYAYPSNPVVEVDLRGLVHRAKSTAKSKSKQNEKKKPNLEQGEVGSYREQHKKAAAPVGLERDHIPSKAAVAKRMEEQLGRPLTGKEKRNLDNNLTTAAIKKGTHEEGRTHGSKNNSDQIKGDSGDLRGAADKDLAAHRENLKRDGMSDAQIDKMQDDIHQRNSETGVYDDKLPTSLLRGPR